MRRCVYKSCSVICYYVTHHKNCFEGNKVILKIYVQTYGHVKIIITDQAKKFRNRLWSETLTQEGIKHVLTSIKHTQGSLAKYVNKELSKNMHIYFHDQHNKWTEYLVFFEKAINENIMK